MEINFGNEHFGINKGVCGVYRILINDKWFYIGSSVDIKRRMGVWKYFLSGNGGKPFRKNRSITHILPDIKKVSFEIVEIVTDGSSPKIREDFYIRENFENEFCLNIVKSATTGKGRKLPMGVIRRAKKKTGIPALPKKVAVFDMSDTLIKICESIGDASRFTGVRSDTIRRIFNGKLIKPKKYIFKPVLESGEIGEVKNTTKMTAKIVNFICDNYTTMGCTKLSRMLNMRQSIVREIAKGRSYKNFIRKTIIPIMKAPASKPVMKFNLDGAFICEYQSINSAAKYSNMALSQVQRVLSGERKQSGGFVFKYTDDCNSG